MRSGSLWRVWRPSGVKVLNNIYVGIMLSLPWLLNLPTNVSTRFYDRQECAGRKLLTLITAQGRSAEGLRCSLVCPAAGAGEHLGCHATAVAWPIASRMGYDVLWCASVIGSPRPGATSPRSPTDCRFRFSAHAPDPP